MPETICCLRKWLLQRSKEDISEFSTAVELLYYSPDKEFLTEGDLLIAVIEAVSERLRNLIIEFLTETDNSVFYSWQSLFWMVENGYMDKETIKKCLFNMTKRPRFAEELVVYNLSRLVEHNVFEVKEVEDIIMEAIRKAEFKEYAKEDASTNLLSLQESGKITEEELQNIITKLHAV